MFLRRYRRCYLAAHCAANPSSSRIHVLWHDRTHTSVPILAATITSPVGDAAASATARSSASFSRFTSSPGERLNKFGAPPEDASDARCAAPSGLLTEPAYLWRIARHCVGLYSSTLLTSVLLCAVRHVRSRACLGCWHGHVRCVCARARASGQTQSGPGTDGTARHAHGHGSTAVYSAILKHKRQYAAAVMRLAAAVPTQ
jgi:hypothetical protein